jgi:hypothetical protein
MPDQAGGAFIQLTLYAASLALAAQLGLVASLVLEAVELGLPGVTSLDRGEFLFWVLWSIELLGDLSCVKYVEGHLRFSGDRALG